MTRTRVVGAVVIAVAAVAFLVARTAGVPPPVIAPQGASVSRPAGAIVSVHMPARNPDAAAANVRRRFPDAVSFMVLLDKKFY